MNSQPSMAFRKVTAFVTRDSEAGREVLTFLHPLGGRQVPAGSVEDGEEPVESAKREVWEETGVGGFEHVALLRVKMTIAEGSGYLTKAQVLRTEPQTSAPGGEQLPRGYKVVINKRSQGWLYVSHRTYDFNVTPATVLAEISGWVPGGVVATTLERHYFHITVAAGGLHTWIRAADGHLFQVEWLPLTPPPALVEGQQEWLDAVHSQLV